MFSCLDSDNDSDSQSGNEKKTEKKVVKPSKKESKQKPKFTEIDNSDGDFLLDLPCGSKSKQEKLSKQDKKSKQGKSQEKSQEKSQGKSSGSVSKGVLFDSNNVASSIKPTNAPKRKLLPKGTIFSDNVELLLDGKKLIHESKIVINNGVKYFLLGKNGCGKTTLLKYLYEKIKDDNQILMIDQDIEITSDLNVKDFLFQSNKPLYCAHLRQIEMDLIDEMTDSELQEYEKLGDFLEAEDWGKFEAETKTILNGLGFDPDQNVNSLSGGWRMKLALGRALLIKPEVLFLDESTNHLDIVAIIWLTNYLKQYTKTIVMITHQIDLVDDLADYVWDVQNIDGRGNKLYEIKGQYDQACQTIAQFTEEMVKKWDALQKEIKQLQSKSTPRKEVEEFIAKKNIPKPPRPYKVTISFENSTYTGYQNIVELNNVSFDYGSKNILSQVNFAIDITSRYILVGRNGAGKTTLFKLCSGLLEPSLGEVKRNDRISIGYYNQQIIEALPLDLTPIEYIQLLCSDYSENECRGLLGRIGLKKTEANDHCKTKIRDLSGGQKARMAFAIIQMNSPEILLLDEPTNHLDIESIQALSDGINKFKGAVIIITHDIHFIESIDEYVIYNVDKQKVTKFNGKFNLYSKYVINQLQEQQTI